MKKIQLDSFQHPRIAYGFYTRQGGESTGIYASLNCSPQSSDDLGRIGRNRARVVDDLGGKDLSTLKQVHNDVCHLVTQDCTQGFEEGDALVTRTPEQVIGVLTADCGPVLFYGEDKDGLPVIGAAHAGWGGALKGVIESTIARMEELGAMRARIHAAIGPCIGQKSYEVGINFRDPFVAEDKRAAMFFAEGASDKLYFDMLGYIAFRLTRAGIHKVAVAGHDTYTMEDDYFSFRRATHRHEKDYGRQISAIMIRKS